MSVLTYKRIDVLGAPARQPLSPTIKISKCKAAAINFFNYLYMLPIKLLSLPPQFEGANGGVKSCHESNYRWETTPS